MKFPGNISRLPDVTWLIIINATVFVVLHLLSSHWPGMLGAISLPADFYSIASTPWSPLTYMFTQYAPGAIIFNMLLLYFYADIARTPPNPLIGWRLWALYAIGGTAGALAYYAACIIGGIASTGLAGSSAAVMGIIIYVTMLQPRLDTHLMFFGRVELRILTLVIVLLSVIATGTDNIDSQAAHAGGFIAGWLCAIAAKRRTGIKPVTARKPVVATPANHSPAPQSDGELLDTLLDKIRRSGYGSLSSDERDTLFTLSKRIRP